MGATNSKEDSSTEAQGVSFEVILSPKVENAKIPELTPKRTGMITRQAIDEKMEATEKRRKNREHDICRKLASEDEHVQEVRQAMSDYTERKKRETQARYQKRLFIFAENQENFVNEKVEQWEEKAKRIEAAKKTVNRKEKSFRESMKEKLTQKFEKFKENRSKYYVNRQETIRRKAHEKLEAVQSSKEKQIEERALATAEKLQRKFEASEENREASIQDKVGKIHKQQLRVQQAKEAMEKSFEITSTHMLMEFEVRLDRSAVKRQLREKEIQEKGKANGEKAKEVKRLREEKERRFSDGAKENLETKFKKAEKMKEENLEIRQKMVEKREQKVKSAVEVKSAAEKNEREKLRVKINEKLQKSEENRVSILNAKVQRCQNESFKVKHTKETAEEQVRQQGKATDVKLQAKLNSYKENRQRRLSERKVQMKPSPGRNQRLSLQEITNDSSTAALRRSSSPQKANSAVSRKSNQRVCNSENTENENNSGKLKELADNFRNRNLDYLGLINK